MSHSFSVLFLLTFLFSLVPTEGLASLSALLRQHAAVRTALLETEQGAEILSLTLGLPVRPGSISRQNLEEALRRFSPSIENALERNLSEFAENPAIRELEQSSVIGAVNRAEREELLQRLRTRAEAWAVRNPGFGLTAVPEASDFFGAQTLQRNHFLSGAAASTTAFSTAAQHLAHSARSALDPRAARLAHQAITTDLFHGIVLSGEPMRANGNFNSIFKVRVLNPNTGRVRDAIFKPRTPGDGNGWNRVPMEYVAYEMNLLLGLDYVPPTAYRYGLEIAGQRFTEGSLSFFVPQAQVLGEVASEALAVSRAAVASDSRILNVLLQNTDAHAKNLLAGPHWADGALRPVFIDFGASLRPGAEISLTRARAAGNSDPIYWIRAQTLNRLRSLNETTLRRVIGPFTSLAEIRGILARRDSLVHEFERLRSTYGDSSILLSE